MAEFLPRLRQGVPIGSGPKGERIEPSPQLILTWQQLVTQLELIPGLEEAIAAANAAAANAQAAADNANAAADSVTSESSLVNSGPVNYTPPLLSADNAGNVTIANHDRQYGDSVLNPTVSVTGGLIASGAAVGDIVRPYYLDPTRAGGAVTYLFTVNDDTAPVQGGDTHVLGAVTIPAAGTQDGNPVRPPGQVSPIP